MRGLKSTFGLAPAFPPSSANLVILVVAPGKSLPVGE